MTGPGQRPQGAGALEWLRSALLSANLVWTTLCLGGFLTGTRVVTVALVAALVIAHALDPKSRARAHPAGWLFLPFIVYAAANVLWVSPVPWLGWIDWLNWTSAFAVFWVVLNGLRSPGPRAFIYATFALLGLTGGLLAAYQHFVRQDWIMLGLTQAAQFSGRSSGSFGIPNSLGVFSAMLLPPALFLVAGRGRSTEVRLAAAVALVGLLAAFVLAISRGAWLALAAACALRPLLTPGSSLLRRLASAFAAVVVVVAVGAAVWLLHPGMRERVHQFVEDSGERSRPILWRGALHIFEEHPLFGAGAGSFDVRFEPFRPEKFNDDPIYAHSDYLSVLSDQGAVGFVLLGAALAWIVWRNHRASGLEGALFTGLLAFGIHLAIDFHFRIPALALSVATLGALVTAQAWPSGASLPEGPALRLAAAAIAVTAVAGSLWAIPKYRAEQIRRDGRLVIDRLARTGRTPDAATAASLEAIFTHAIALDPGNGQAWSDLACAASLDALANHAQTVPLGVAVVGYADRAIRICPDAAEFWVRKGIGLDMQRRWIEGGACFVKALQLAPMRADFWYYDAYHLSLAPNETGPALAAVNLSLRLDSGLPFAQSLRDALAARPQ